MLCLEGADCIRDASCDFCEGIACTRIISYNMEDNREVALTCIPHDTRSPLAFRNFPYEEEGCKHVGDRQFCVCFSRNYCNSSRNALNSSTIVLIVTILFLTVNRFL
ncbi:unnamed protein product [Auanema sp. JU1783]|nr:unnamed protein product [Auanema sp. JU1783]